MSPRRFALAVCVLAAAWSTASCENGTSPLAPRPVDQPTRFSETFFGTLAVRGSAFYSFQVVVEGTVGITFAGLMTGTNGAALSTPVELGVGIPAGTGCPTTATTTASTALSPQLSTSMTPGIYCVKITDPGNLTAAASFAIRISHY